MIHQCLSSDCFISFPNVLVYFCVPITNQEQKFIFHHSEGWEVQDQEARRVLWEIPLTLHNKALVTNDSMMEVPFKL